METASRRAGRVHQQQVRGRGQGCHQQANHGQDGFIQGTFYVVRIEELLKGNSLENVEIYDENSSGRFPMRVGRRYLLFAYEGAFEGVEGLRLAINNCGNSGTLRQVRKQLTIVRELKKARHSP